jgi:glycosyltransferase involved in cell wall biosynthesis
MILAGRDFPPDIRVEKEARALSQAGHQVVIACNNMRDRPSESEWQGCQVMRVSQLPLLPRKLNSLMMKTTFHDEQWYRLVSQLVRKRQIDILHVHDLPMVGTALRVGKRYGLPVIADLHENYPAALEYYQPDELPWYKRMLAFLDAKPRWQAYEKRCALQADHVLVVVDEAEERLIKLGIPPSKVTVIENTLDVDYFTGIELDKDLIAQYRDDFMISYIGGFGGCHRGLDTVVKAMLKVLEEIPSAKLVLVGRGPIKPVLEAMVIERSLEEHVTFIDWQPFEKVPSFIKASQVCLVPHQSNPHTEATSPHKLFQYMIMGKPVVASTCKPLKRVVQETGSGLVFQAGDSESLAQTILKLKDEKLRDAGRQAVLEKYNWERTSQILLDVYERIA